MEPIWKNAQSFIDDIKDRNIVEQAHADELETIAAEAKQQAETIAAEAKAIANEAKQPRLDAIRLDLDKLVKLAEDSFNVGNECFNNAFSEAAKVLPEGKIENSCKKIMAALKSLAQFSNEDRRDGVAIMNLRALSVSVNSIGNKLVKSGDLGNLDEAPKAFNLIGHINKLQETYDEMFDDFVDKHPELKSFIERDKYILQNYDILGDFLDDFEPDMNTFALEMITATAEIPLYVQGFNDLIDKALLESRQEVHDKASEFFHCCPEIEVNNYFDLSSVQSFLKNSASSGLIPNNHMGEINKVGEVLGAFKADYPDECLSDFDIEDGGEQAYHEELAREQYELDAAFHESENDGFDFEEERPSSDKYLMTIGDDIYSLTLTEGHGEFSNEAGYTIEKWEKNGVEHRLGGPAFSMNSKRHHYEGEWGIVNERDARFVLDGIVVSSEVMPDSFKAVDKESIINLSKMMDDYITEAKTGSVDYAYNKINNIAKTVLSMTSNDPDVKKAHDSLKEMVTSDFSSYTGVYLGKTPESLEKLEKCSADFCKAGLVSIRDISKEQDLSHEEELNV